MILDPTDRFIATITAHCDISDSRILEIGCGKGRITRDLARHARTVVASDPDGDALTKARATVAADNVTFVRAGVEDLDFSSSAFDYVIYSLSLHHIPPERMPYALELTGRFLTDDGKIIVIEPDDGGSMNEAKVRFGAGSGEETEERHCAIQAMQNVPGWMPGETVRFRTLFRFDDHGDFITSMLPGFAALPDERKVELADFLGRYGTEDGIILESDRRMNVLSRKIAGAT